MQKHILTFALILSTISMALAQQSIVQLHSENMAFFTVSIDGIRLASDASVHQKITGLKEGNDYNLLIDYLSPEFSDVRTRLVLHANGGRGSGVYNYTIPSFFQNELRFEGFVPMDGMGLGGDGMGMEEISINMSMGETNMSMSMNANAAPMGGGNAQQQNAQQQIAQPQSGQYLGQAHASMIEATQQTQQLPQSQPQQVIYVDGYSGQVGCEIPVGANRFERMMERIYDASFSDEKVSIAKQILRTNCLVVSQLVEILEEIAFDEGQLELAKFAYEHVYDLENYFEVYGVFSFSSSSEELDEFIESQY